VWLGAGVPGPAAEAQEVFDRLTAVGIDFEDVLLTLEKEGVDKFKKSWTELVETVSGQMEKARQATA
jgi:transaldolase